MARVLIVDDHPLFRDALKLSLTKNPKELALADTSAIDFSESLEQARRLLKNDNEIELILLDLHLPGINGFWGLLELRKQFPHIAVLVVSGNDEPEVMAKARMCGAVGFISKSLAADGMLQAVRDVLNGLEYWPEVETDVDQNFIDIPKRINELTDQQLRVLRHLQEGRLNKQIAYDLDISEATVKAHVTAIFRKLKVVNRTQAVIVANRLEIDYPSTL